MPAYYILVKDKGKLDYKGDGCQATISSKGRAAFIQTTNEAEATVNTNNMTLKVTTAKKSDQNSDPAAAAGKEAHGFVAAGDSEMNITATNLKAQADDATGKDLVSVFTMEDKGKISLEEKNARLRVGEGEVERNVDWNVTNKVSNDEKLQEDQSLQENELQTNDTTEGEPAVVKSEYWTTH